MSVSVQGVVRKKSQFPASPYQAMTEHGKGVEFDRAAPSRNQSA